MSVLTQQIIKPLLGSVLLLSSLSVFAADLTIDIEEVRGTKGKLHVAVFDKAAAYKKPDYDQAYATFTLAINPKSNRLTLHDLPKGHYAISLFHDENDNNKMETALTGMPKEGYGTSNATDKYDELSFAKARVKLGDKDKTVNVTVHYMGK